MLKSALYNAAFSAADTQHFAPYQKISFATQQSNTTSADTSNLTLSNIVLCSIGEAEGWGISIDETFVTAMVKDIKANMKKGVKSNLRHNHENAGFQLGRITNVRIDGERVVGDLKCYAAADKSPLAPGMATWLVELVQEDPEAMMMSIVANVAYFYQKDENGNEVKVWEYNSDDRWISPNYDMPIYAAYGGIESCDAVADGALTEAMFSRAPHTDGSLFTQILAKVKRSLGITASSGPDEIDDAKPTNIKFSNQEIDMTKEELQELLDGQKAALEVSFGAKVDEIKAQFETKVGELATEKTELQAAVAAKDDALVAAAAKIEKLSAAPAADHSGGATASSTGKVSMGANHDWLKARYNLP